MSLSYMNVEAQVRAMRAALLAQGYTEQDLGWLLSNGWDPNPPARYAGSAAKRWFNARRPFRRRCLHRWCMRVQTYDYRCHLHQEDA